MYWSDVGIVHTKPALLAALVGILRKAWRQSGVLQWNLVMQLWSGTLKCCLWLIPSTPNGEMLMWMVWFHLFFFSFFFLLSFPCSQSCFLAAFGLNMFLLRAVLTILLSIVVSRAFLTVLFLLCLTFVCLCRAVCSFSSQKKKNKTTQSFHVVKLWTIFIHSLIGETFRMSPAIKLTLVSVSPSLGVFWNAGTGWVGAFVACSLRSVSSAVPAPRGFCLGVVHEN